MRNFQMLDSAKENPDAETLELYLAAVGSDPARLLLRREGNYVIISASYGPLEIALRPRYDELVRILARLHPTDGYHTPRQVGTGQAYVALGLTNDQQLLLRPTIVADATGHLSFNIAVQNAAREALYNWLQVPKNATGALSSEAAAS